METFTASICAFEGEPLKFKELSTKVDQLKEQRMGPKSQRSSGGASALGALKLDTNQVLIYPNHLLKQSTPTYHIEPITPS